MRLAAQYPFRYTYCCHRYPLIKIWISNEVIHKQISGNHQDPTKSRRQPFKPVLSTGSGKITCGKAAFRTLAGTFIPPESKDSSTKGAGATKKRKPRNFPLIRDRALKRIFQSRFARSLRYGSRFRCFLCRRPPEHNGHPRLLAFFTRGSSRLHVWIPFFSLFLSRSLLGFFCADARIRIPHIFIVGRLGKKREKKSRSVAESRGKTPGGKRRRSLRFSFPCDLRRLSFTPSRLRIGNESRARSGLLLRHFRCMSIGPQCKPHDTSAYKCAPPPFLVLPQDAGTIREGIA